MRPNLIINLDMYIIGEHFFEVSTAMKKSIFIH